MFECLPLARFGHIDPDANDTAIARPSLFNLQPASIGELLFDGNAVKRSVPAHPFGHPFIDIPGVRDKSTGLTRGSQNILIQNAGSHLFGGQPVNFAVARVAKHQTVLGIVQHKALRDRLDGIDQPLARLPRFPFGGFGPQHRRIHRGLMHDRRGNVGPGAAIAREQTG